MKRFGPPAFSLALITVLVISFLPSRSAPAYAVSPDIVISQVYGGGGNANAIFTNDFVELFNRGASTVSVAGWSIQYTSATGTGNFGSNSGLITPLSGSLAPGHYLLVQEAAGATTFASLPTPDVTDSTPIPMSATGGKVALVNTTTPLGCNGSSTPCSAAALATIVDLVGWDGANFYEGTGPAPTTSNLTAIFRKDGGNTDTDNNANDFVTGTPAPRNSSGNPYAYGKASPNTALPGTTSLLTVVIIPGYLPASTGFTVSCDLSPIGGSASQPLYDDGTNGDVTASDNTFSYLATILSGTASGAKSLACAFTENEGRNGSATITLTVGTLVPIPIGTVNGPVLDTDNGTAHVSPYVGKLVTVQGVIYEKTLQATTTPGTYKGFFLQNTLATADTNPNTSDGLFVFMNTSSTLGSYTPTVGDEVILSGTVSEFHNMTELVSPLTLNAVVRGNADSEISPAEANPPTALADANRYWERLQGMRVRAPAGSLVLGGRNVFSPADAEIWLARSDSTIALRDDPYTRRAFRDAHPLDDNYDAANWDGNGYRMLLGSLGIKATAGNAQALIDPARTFSTLTNSPSGGLNYTFSKYRIEISDQPTFDKGVDPAANNPPQARERDNEFTIVDYNLENLYDYRDNPASGCDFAGNTGCTAAYPFIGDIIPAFNYVPANDEDYQKRLSDIATQIISDLHSPDVLMLQEVENQDFCKVADGALACDTGNADGKPDVLQDLALEIAHQGGPAYGAAYDPDSSDLRGIAPAFLYRTDRVELLPAAGDPVLGATPAIGSYTSVPYDSDVSNPKTLNAIYSGSGKCETNWVFPRAPDVGLFRIHAQAPGSNGYRDVYVIDNHFKSGPDTCVAHRTEQAKFNAALVAFIQAANPEASIVVGGDLNVYPRPDDIALNADGTLSTDQLGSLYDPSLGLKNLWEVLLSQAPESAYSYVFVGMAQTLDQMFINSPLLAGLEQFRTAHINSDFAADDPNDVARGTSDHDPDVAKFGIFNWTGFLQPVDNLPEVNVARAGSVIPVKFSLSGDQGLNIFAAGYPRSTKFACDTSAPQDSIEETLTSGSSGLSYDPLTDTYTYVWKTDKAWAGTCRQLTVELVDGSTYRANFSFTK